MLHRQDSEGLILITQPAHAWLSGQIARHWGGGPFEPPGEDVCLAAELHDIGFLDWEEAPTLNPETGLPHDFMNMPPDLHLGIWSRGVRHMLRFGRYPALLVSMHFTHISRQNWVSRKKDGVIKEYQESQEIFQTSAMTSLLNDSYYGSIVTEETAIRDQQLVSLFDWLSLLVCLKLKEEKTIPDVPCRTGKTDLKVLPLDSHSRFLKLDPWPLRVPRLRLVVEGRRLLKTYTDQEQMRAAIKAAARISVVTELCAEAPEKI